MYQFWQILKRDFLNLLYNPMWIFFSFFYPLLLVGILGFLTSGSYGNSITSYDYYGISILIFSALNTAMTAANSFMEERIKKGNMRLIYSPLPKDYIYLSKILASFAFSFLCHLGVILLLIVVLQVNFGGINLSYIIFLLLCLEIFASILGVLFCCIFKSESISNQILSIVITVFAIMGGLFFRLDGLGDFFVKLSLISPFKWIITDIFKIIYDNDFSSYMSTVYTLLTLSLIALLLCRELYQREDYI